MNDQQLERILKELRDQNPEAHQIEKWKKSLRSPGTRRASDYNWSALLVACFVGFVVGAFSMVQFRWSSSSPEISISENLENLDATFETVVTKLD